MFGGSDGKTSDPLSPTMDLLYMAAGGWVAQAIHVAAKLGIADTVEDGAKTPAEIAAITGSHPEALHRLLRTLASLGVFAEDAEGRFGLTPIADGLRSSAPVSLRAFAVMLGEDMLWRPWGNLCHSVQTGEAAFAHVFGQAIYYYLGSHSQAAAVFDAAISDRARQENGAVVEAYDWWPQLIVDVGGGQGSLLPLFSRTPSPAAASCSRRHMSRKGLAGS